MLNFDVKRTEKIRNTQRLRSGTNVIACFRTSASSLLFSKTQYSSDIASKIRIVLEKIIVRYKVRKPNFRPKMRILNSLIVPRISKRDPLGFFNFQFAAK